MVENVIKRPETASVSMDGQGRLANFCAHSVNSDVTVLNGVIVKMGPVVTERQVVASAYPDGVVNTVRNRVPVGIMDQSVRRLVNVRMERFVMQSVGTVHVNLDGGGRSVIDPASKDTMASTVPNLADVPTPNPATTSPEDVNARKDTPVTPVQNCVQMEHMVNRAPINATVVTTPSVMRLPENASVNLGIRVRTVRVDVFKEGSVRIVTSYALVRMEAFVTRLRDPVFVLLDILGQSVRLRVKRIDMGQPVKKSAPAKTVVPVTGSPDNAAASLDSLE